MCFALKGHMWGSPTKAALTRILGVVRCVIRAKPSESPGYFGIGMKVAVQTVWKLWLFEVAKCYIRTAILIKPKVEAFKLSV